MTSLGEPPACTPKHPLLPMGSVSQSARVESPIGVEDCIEIDFDASLLGNWALGEGGAKSRSGRKKGRRDK